MTSSPSCAQPLCAVGCTTALASALATSRPYLVVAKGAAELPLRSMPRLQVRRGPQTAPAALAWTLREGIRTYVRDLDQESCQDSAGAVKLAQLGGKACLLFLTLCIPSCLRWPHQAHPQEPRVRWPLGEARKWRPPPVCQRAARHGSHCRPRARHPDPVLNVLSMPV